MVRKPKTRADGEGTLYQESPNKWRAELWIDGKKVSRTAKTKKLAAQKLVELKAIRDQRLRLADGRQTLTAWIAYWLDTIAPAQGLKPNTTQGHRWACAKYIEPHLGHIALADLTEGHVERWLQTLAATPAAGRGGKVLSFNTRRLALRRLRTALNLAVARRAIAENVAARVKLFQSSEFQSSERITETAAAQRYLNPAQIRTLLDRIEDHRLYALYALAATIGARQGELIGLRWSQVQLDGAEPCLTIREQLQRLKGPDGKRIIHRESTKNKRLRTIYLAAELVPILRAHKARQASERAILGQDWQAGDLVFTSVAGTPLEGSRLRRQFKGMLSAAELPDVTFHSLRHSAGSMMLATGAQIVDVAEVLGHSSPLVTARIYAHAFVEGQRTAVAAVARLLLTG